MTAEAIEVALARVREDPPRVVCLPDLFLDHFVDVPSWAQADERVRAAVDRGGGNLLDTPQSVQPGGNAANTAWALARLGAEAEMVGVTSAGLETLFERTLGRDGVDLSLVDTSGRPSLTTVLSVGDPPANAMMNEPGSLAGYRPERIDHAERETIARADAMLVANWASMRAHGTDVVQAAVEEAEHAGTLAYVDAADPTERSPAARSELVEALAEAEPTVWAMNEHEARAFAEADEVGEAGSSLAERTGASVDVHTHERAVSFDGQGRTEVPVFEVAKVHRTTGAGDAFNAGNLLGHVLGLEAQARLTLAHAVAGCYVSRRRRRPPAAKDVVGFAKALSR